MESARSSFGSCVGGIDSSRVPGVRKIAVLRANALGDLVFTLPALWALRGAYPDAQIVILGRAWHEELFARPRMPVDRAVAVPGIHQINDHEPELGGRVAAFVTHMRDEGFDLALQCQGGGDTANHLVTSFGARVTAGLRAPGAPALDRWVRYDYHQPEVLRFLDVVALVGAAPVAVVPHLSVHDSDATAAAALVDLEARPLVLIHPGARDPRRRWPAESFAAVGDALVRRGAQVVVIGDATDADVAAAVGDAMAEDALNLCGATSLSALVGLVANARLVVANDSGPRHLAEAVGTPTVAVYWFGNLLPNAPTTRHGHRVAVSWQTMCPVCGVALVGEEFPLRTGGVRCRHNCSLVADVPAERVMRLALELFDDPPAMRTRPARPEVAR